MKLHRAILGFSLTSSLALAAGQVNAQDASQQAPAQAVAPTDVQTIGDWIVRCYPVKSISPCEMYQQEDEKTTHQLVLAVSIAYVPSLDRHAMQIVVPLGVSVAKGAILQTSAFTSNALPYHHCDRAGCYVQLVLPSNQIDAIAHAGDEAKVKIVADNGRPYDLALSLKGFSEAQDAMVKLAREKAQGAPASAAAPAKK